MDPCPNSVLYNSILGPQCPHRKRCPAPCTQTSRSTPLCLYSQPGSLRVPGVLARASLAQAYEPPGAIGPP